MLHLIQTGCIPIYLSFFSIQKYHKSRKMKPHVDVVVVGFEGRLHNTCCEKKNDSNDEVVGGGGHNLGVAELSVSRFEVPQLSWWVS